MKMNLILIALLFFITNNENYAKECHRVERDGQEEPRTTLSADSEEIEELIKNKNTESLVAFISKIYKKTAESSNTANEEESSKTGYNKAFACSKLDCFAEDTVTPVCACNFITGNVASFKNKCDAQKHNCRFDTNFKVILEEICPWEFAFRRIDKEFEFDYRDPKYYN